MLGIEKCGSIPIYFRHRSFYTVGKDRLKQIKNVEEVRMDTVLAVVILILIRLVIPFILLVVLGTLLNRRQYIS